MAFARSIPDDLIHDILVRLPATAVLRFRAVCKKWRAIVDDPRFPSAHHRHRPRMPLLCLRHDDPPDHPTTSRHFRVHLEAIDLRARATCPVIRFTVPARRDYIRRVPRPGSVRSPPAAEEADGQAHALVELDGKLTMTLTRGDVATAELWVLQDYEREDSWTCELKVPLPSEADIVRDRPGAVIVVSLEGDVIVQCTRCLLQCDTKGRVRMRHQPAAHHRIIAVPHLFRESLVPHDSVNGREIRIGYGGI